MTPPALTISRILAGIFSDQGWVIEQREGAAVAVTLVQSKGNVELALDISHISSELERRLS